MKTIIPIEQLSIPPTGIHLIIKVYINRKVARFVIDTGASQTVLDLHRISHFIPKGEKRKLDSTTAGIGTNKIRSAASTIKHFKIGTAIAQDYDIVLLDLSHVNNSYQLLGFKTVDGILGSDLLKNFEAVIDFKKLQLTLEKK
jgi:predicted aspartyl protease